MIAVAMAYAAAIGLMLAIAGLGLERIAAIARGPRRWIWAGLLAANLAIASMPWWRPATELTPVSVSINVTTTSVGPRADSPLAPSVIERLRIEVRHASVGLAQWGRAAVWVWGIGTAGVALIYLARLLVLSKRRRRWRKAVVDNTTVFVTGSDGPGVAGLLTPCIVLPEWALSLDATERSLILRHEHEHLNAHDPLLIQLASMSVLLMPWNPAAWWMLSRLKLAVEIDCDARVLRRAAGATGPDAAQYAELLLTVATHRSNLSALSAPAMLEPPSSLGRRITAMTPIRTRFPGLQSACAGTVALAVVAMVFTVPAPRMRAQSAPMPDVKPAPTAMPAPRMAPAETVAAAQAPQPAPTPVPATQTPPTPTPAPAPAAPPAVEQATQLDPQKPEDEFGKGAYMPGTLHGVTLPTVIKQVDPEYTSEAMQAKLQGMVRMQAVINSDGRIGEIRVTRGFPKVHPDGTPAPEGKGLEDAAVEAAKGWIFEPSRRNGVAVPVIVEMELEFRLDGRADRQR